MFKFQLLHLHMQNGQLLYVLVFFLFDNIRSPFLYVNVLRANHVPKHTVYVCKSSAITTNMIVIRRLESVDSEAHNQLAKYLKQIKRHIAN